MGRATSISEPKSGILHGRRRVCIWLNLPSADRFVISKTNSVYRSCTAQQGRHHAHRRRDRIPCPSPKTARRLRRRSPGHASRRTHGTPAVVDWDRRAADFQWVAAESPEKLRRFPAGSSSRTAATFLGRSTSPYCGQRVGCRVRLSTSRGQFDVLLVHCFGRSSCCRSACRPSASPQKQIVPSRLGRGTVCSILTSSLA